MSYRKNLIFLFTFLILTTHSVKAEVKIGVVKLDVLFKEIAIYKGPTLVDSKILISNQKGIISIIDADNGTEIKTVNVDELAIPPIPVDGSLLFLTTKGMLLAYK